MSDSNITPIETDLVVIGAGPVGLFTVFEAGMLKMRCHVVDTLEHIGGQCSALYPEKPIYDIPGFPQIAGQDLVDNLEKQAAPFDPVYHLGQQVVSVQKASNGTWDVITCKHTRINAKAIIVAAGCGAFGPNRPPIENIAVFEQKSVFYSVPKKEAFRDKNVVIAGGGDSAVDWAIALQDVAKSIALVHRRPKFRCAPDSSDKIASLAAEGKLNLVVPYQLSNLHGKDGELRAVEVATLKGETRLLEADRLLCFFGLAMELGPIADWGLSINMKHIVVHPGTMETNVPGIYAVGDIATYPNKLKLILSGFAETATACHSARKIVHPNEAYHFEYSTTSGVPA